MITIEVNGQYITWPDDFAIMMMKYYRKHDVPFMIHRNCIHTGRDTCAENTSLVRSIGIQENRENHPVFSGAGSSGI
jgi:hypothetical protein